MKLALLTAARRRVAQKRKIEAVVRRKRFAVKIFESVFKSRKAKLDRREHLTVGRAVYRLRVFNAVFVLAHYRTADKAQMRADLMRSARMRKNA